MGLAGSSERRAPRRPQHARLRRRPARHLDSLARRRPAPPCAPPEHGHPQPPQHPLSLRPGHRLLCALPRPLADLLLRHLRDRGDLARGGAARQARPDRAGARARPGRPRDRDRVRLGSLCAPCREPLRLPRHHDDDQPFPVRLRARASRARRGLRTRRAPLRGLPPSRGPLRQGRLDRDVRGRGPLFLRRLLFDRGPPPASRRGDAAPDHLDERGALPALPLPAGLHPTAHLPGLRARLDRRDPPLTRARHVALRRRAGGDRPPLRPDARSVAAELSRQPRARARARLPGDLHPHVGLLPRLLPGRFRGTLHRRRPDPPREGRRRSRPSHGGTDRRAASGLEKRRA